MPKTKNRYKGMIRYRQINNITGWMIFAIAAFTYCSTIEPTASFWDCPEFISTAAKLEVGHPPGAPFFMLVGNMFSHFASSPEEVAKMINIMSALLSAGCILFLFWTITHLAKELIHPSDDNVPMGKTIAIMASGLAGSLIYTWSDTFWFSAVEGEVYAFSSFFTALVFWITLKSTAEGGGNVDKWLILIAYLMGLSIGVHLLNLLCIPAMVLVYYYKFCKNPTVKGSLFMLILSACIIGFILYGVVPGVLIIAGWFELLFVNTLGMPYYSGLFVYVALLLILIVWSLYATSHTRKERIMRYFSPRVLNTSILCLTVMLIGYSSYAITAIRSMANTPMDQNSPEDVFALRDYLAREQYGDTPKLWGQTYASEPSVVIGKDGELEYEHVDKGPVYQKKTKYTETDKDEYVSTMNKFDLRYPSNQCMFFPRMYSERHRNEYEQWLGDIHYKTVDYNIPTIGTRKVSIPSQYDNLRFFFTYQLNFMYWRYFMWNFAGRQNDIQGRGELEHGNWLTGISFIDNIRLGDQNLLPDELKGNKGHNVFYCLPLVLGLIGLFWQLFRRGRTGAQQFWVVFFLFFMTGIAIVLYVNQTPSQPRERDYSYAGSFYAFSIWCGLGITALYNILKGRLRGKATIMTIVIPSVVAVAVPVQMVTQTWDDHDRSGRYLCRDFGLNYLETVPHDGIIFSCGDNDTFPLWYNEDVEGNRTDVRVCNLEYLNTDWYIDQMKRPAYTGKGASSPLPISWTRQQYAVDVKTMISVNPQISLGDSSIRMKDFIEQVYEKEPEVAHKIWGDDPFELKTAIRKFILKEDIPSEYKEFVDALPACLPSEALHLKVDKEAVRKSGMKIPEGKEIPDYMDISLSGQSSVTKAFVLILEMLAQSNFSRPLYVSTGIGKATGNLYRHFMLEGLAYRITPFTFEENEPYHITAVNTDRMYEIVMNKFHYGNVSQPGIYLDEVATRMCFTHRRMISILATKLVEEGKYDKAVKVLDKCEKEFPSYNVPHNPMFGSLDMATVYLQCGQVDKATAILGKLKERGTQYINWYSCLPEHRFKACSSDYEYEMRVLYAIEQTRKAIKCN